MIYEQKPPFINVANFVNKKRVLRMPYEKKYRIAYICLYDTPSIQFW